MVKAQQVEKDGTPHGAVTTFTDEQWNYMVRNYGKKLRWVEVGRTSEEDNSLVEFPDEMELPKKEPDPDKIEFTENDFDSYDFDNTKSEIIKDFCMDEGDMRLSKSALIEKVHNKVLNKE